MKKGEIVLEIKYLPPLGHVGVVVPDLEKALDELKILYGLDGKAGIYEFVPMHVWAWGKEIEGCKIRIAMLQWTENLKLEILQPVFGKIEHQRFVDEVGGGLHHIAFYVEDYDAYRKHIEQIGGEIIFETETEDDKQGYRRCCYAKFKATQMVIEVLEKAWFRNK